jgi:hypothetical protein
MSRAFWLGVVAYVVPSFVIAYPWHLAVFARQPTASSRCIAMTSSCRSACCRC